MKPGQFDCTGLFLWHSSMKTVAIIPAGGYGKRMGADVSKQYLLLNGIPVLVHTLRVFQELPLIDDIFLIVPADDVEFVKLGVVEEYGLTRVSRVLPGGMERQDSVRNGIELVGPEYDVVVIHDGVRPFVTADLICAVVSEVAAESAVTLGVPVKDTVKVVDSQRWIKGTLDRNEVWLTQTPQAFRRDIIKTAYEAAYKDHHYGTDDASLVERIGVGVKMIFGSYYNIKITTKDDIVLADALMKKFVECGHGSDV